MPYIKLGVTVFEYSTAICEEFLMKSKGIENYQKFESFFFCIFFEVELTTTGKRDIESPQSMFIFEDTNFKLRSNYSLMPAKDKHQ